MLNRTQQPKIKRLNEITIIPPERKTMRNGITLNIINAGEQEVVRVDFMFKGGRYQQTKPLQALFTNRMLREGSSKFTSTDISNKLDYYGAWLELSSSCEYSYISLYTLNKYFPYTIEIIESIIKEPTFPEKEFNTVLDANKQQFLVNQTRMDFISQKYFNLAVFGCDHPSGNSITLDDYLQLNREDLQEFHNCFYNSDNCSIYISGRTTEAIISSLEEKFGYTSWGNIKEKFVYTHPLLKPHTEKRLFIEHPDAMQNSLRIGGPTITHQHPDYLKMKVVTTLLGGYFGCRLMTNIREDKGYTYGISAGIITYPGTNLLVISTEADSEYTENIIKEVYCEIDTLKKQLITEEELDMVKNYMAGSMYRNYEGPFSISDTWMLIESEHLDDNYLRKYLDAILSITQTEVMELSQLHLLSDTFIEVIAGKKIHNKL